MTCTSQLALLGIALATASPFVTRRIDEPKPTQEINALIIRGRDEKLEPSERLIRFRAIVDRARALHDGPGEAEAQYWVGRCLGDAKQYADAIEAMGLAVTQTHDLGMKSLEARALIAKGYD